jgi:hypothetical protein
LITMAITAMIFIYLLHHLACLPTYLTYT